jgi:hypothetical protein
MKLPRISAALVRMSSRPEPSSLGVESCHARIVPCLTIGKVKFADGWDGDNNNDYPYFGAGQFMTAQDIHDLLTTSESDAVKEAAECGILTVAKGCHQAAPKTHFTINVEHNTKGVSKKCQANPLFASKGLHLDCWTGKVITT